MRCCRGCVSLVFVGWQGGQAAGHEVCSTVAGMPWRHDPRWTRAERQALGWLASLRVRPDLKAWRTRIGAGCRQLGHVSLDRERVSNPSTQRPWLLQFYFL
jgi:hypothetical protein